MRMNQIYKFYYAAFLLIVSFGSSAQEYFNNRFEYDALNSIDAAKSLLEVQNGYIVGGMTGGKNPGWFRIALRMIDYSGNEMWTKTWGKDSTQYWLGNPGSVIHTKDQGYALCGTYKDPVDGDAALFMKFDENFDTIFSKYYIDSVTPFNIYHYLLQCIEVENNNYVLVGIWMPYGDRSKIWLIKVDEWGNIIWEKNYGINPFYSGGSVQQTSDSGFIIGGKKFVLGYLEYNDPVIIKVDSLGNQEWIKYIGGPYYDSPAKVSRSNDGGIIAGTCKGDTMVSPDSVKGKIKLMKLNNDGDIIWERSYGSSTIDKYLFNVRCMDDGTIVATGFTTTQWPHFAGWILKVNNQGDSLWYREYDNITGPDSRNWLIDVIQTRDNSYLACGQLFPVYPDTGSQDAWVIKLDSIGCEYPFCDTTVGISEMTFADSDGFWVYPNPSQSFINFGLKHSSCRLQVAVLSRAK